MDNAFCHHRLSIADSLEKQQCSIKYLPPYSPDLNPIENLWGALKAKLKNIYRHVCKDFLDAVHAVLEFYLAPESPPLPSA